MVPECVTSYPVLQAPASLVRIYFLPCDASNCCDACLYEQLMRTAAFNQVPTQPGTPELSDLYPKVWDLGRILVSTCSNVTEYYLQISSDSMPLATQCRLFTHSRVKPE